MYFRALRILAAPEYPLLVKMRRYSRLITTPSYRNAPRATVNDNASPPFFRLFSVAATLPPSNRAQRDTAEAHRLLLRHSACDIARSWKVCSLLRSRSSLQASRLIATSAP
ncbi:unnamed protein product [Parajaminaea phylloscopi]